MITQYRVNKPFGCATVGDYFVWDEDLNMYLMTSKMEADGTSSFRSMCISADIANEYNKSNLLLPYVEEKEDSVAIEKLVKIEKEIAKLRKIYDQRNESMKKKYADGRVPTCQKVEHDTVYFNMTKLLNRFESLLNE